MVAPVEESVPPKKYGGTEIVVYNLITELVRLGHQVTLYASGDSQVPCELVPIFPQAIRTIEPYASDGKSRNMAKFVGLAKVIKSLNTRQFDLVHDHTNWRFFIYANLVKIPTVSTLHGHLGETYQKMIVSFCTPGRLISISDNQRKGMPELQYVATIYNGIDTALYPFKEKPEGDYLLFLARFSPEKGAREAIEVAKKSGQKLLMAAKVDQVDRQYFEESKALIDGRQIVFLGELGMAEKVNYLQNAKALLAPIAWEEPFGLFLVEAMSCGTPVLGMARGSFPEIIVPGKNGFLANSVEEMVEQVKLIGTIERKACRQTVEERFTKEVMAAKYVEVYQKIVSS